MLKKLLKEQIWAILIYLAMMIFSGWILMAYHMGTQALIFFEACFFVCGVACLLIYLLPRHRFYQEAIRAEKELEEKYMLYDVLEPPGFLEGQILCSLMEEAGRSMKQQVSAYERASREYREYIEAWVHEVKTPIASGKLLAENNPSEQMDAMASELSKIDAYIEQALYYARSSSAEKDYLVRRYSLEELVRGALRSQARPLILGGVAVHLKRLDYTVYTDAKWMNFMLGQILGNSAKYGAKNLQIWAEESQESILLHLADDGIGVGQQEIGRIFEKGFTGENGRVYGKSTGMGLYLCKKLADKLGLGISAYSAEKGGLRISLVFPKGSLTEM